MQKLRRQRPLASGSTLHLAPRSVFPIEEILRSLRSEIDRRTRHFHDDFHGKPGLRREAGSWGNVTEDDVRQSRVCYFAQTEQLDAQIGRLLDTLDKTGQAEQHYRRVHDRPRGNGRGASHVAEGWIPYEESYRVPMVVRWPGHIQSGSRTSHLVQTHDLAHTYVAAAGAQKMPYSDGRNYSRYWKTLREAIGRMRSFAHTMEENFSIRSASRSPSASSMCSTGSITMSSTI